MAHATLTPTKLIHTPPTLNASLKPPLPTNLHDTCHPTTHRANTHTAHLEHLTEASLAHQVAQRVAGAAPGARPVAQQRPPPEATAVLLAGQLHGADLMGRGGGQQGNVGFNN